MPVKLRIELLAVGTLLALHGGGPLVAAEAQRAAYRINGVRFDVVTLQLPGEPSRIAEALLADWSRAGAGGARLQRRGEIWLVGRQRGSRHETVELRAGPARGTVAGRVASVDLAGGRSGPPPLPFQLPPGLRVLRAIEHLDVAERPVVLLLASRVGVESTWARLGPALQGAGFTGGARPTAATGAAATRIVAVRGPRDSVEGVIRAHPAGARLVLLHRRRTAEVTDASR